jgi:hypothetical protein
MLNDVLGSVKKYILLSTETLLKSAFISIYKYNQLIQVTHMSADFVFVWQQGTFVITNNSTCKIH